MQVLTWNLYHGRAVPAAHRDLLGDFARRLAGWSWDVALLQEVLPWWPAELGAACGAQAFRVLTSRNWCPPLQRAIGARDPELLKSGAGGANALLVRGGGVRAHARRRLTLLPERRWAHGVELADGTWVVNLHATVRDEARAQRDVRTALAAAERWAGGAPLVLGGDLNLPRAPELAGLTHVAGHFVDHLYARGLRAAGRGETLERGPLSDHAPVRATLSP